MNVKRGARIAVTGSAGVIGRELLKRLEERGAETLSIDRLPLPAQGNFQAKHLQIDLADHPLDAIRDFQPEALIHLAAAFERSAESPEFSSPNWHDNILATHRVVEMTAEVPTIKHVVFASSYLIYSPTLYMSEKPVERPLLKETDPILPRNICGCAKYYAEREFDFLAHLRRTDIRTAHARIYRVYGRGSRDVISRWVRAALKKEPIELFNRDNRFDYIFAGDVAEGLLRILETANARGVVNLGSGQPRSVSEMLTVLDRVIPGTASRVRDHGVKDAYEASGADVTRLRQLTGWSPPTNIETGIQWIAEYERGAE